jgi:hypothetical protein
MDKTDHQKIQEVYHIVLHDLQQWSQDIHINDERFQMLKFNKSEDNVSLGKLVPCPLE